MPTVADVLRQYGPDYLERFGATMPAEHKKVLQAIMACRTGELGTVFYECTSCGHTHVMGRSCGNRHCPSCQHDKTKAWLETQSDRLLSCPYFLLTFTVPAGCATGFAVISASPTPRCSRRPARRSRTWPPIPSLSVLLSAASSVCCTLGAALWSITRTFITWCPAGASAPMVPVAAVACPVLGAGACLVDPVCAKFRDALDRAGLLAQVDPGGVASSLGRPFPSLLATAGLP